MITWRQSPCTSSLPHGQSVTYKWQVGIQTQIHLMLGIPILTSTWHCLPLYLTASLEKVWIAALLFLVSNPSIFPTFGINLSAVIVTPRLLLRENFLESICAGFASALLGEKLSQVVEDFFFSQACCDVTAHSTERNVWKMTKNTLHHRTKSKAMLLTS